MHKRNSVKKCINGTGKTMKYPKKQIKERALPQDVDNLPEFQKVMKENNRRNPYGWGLFT